MGTGDLAWQRALRAVVADDEPVARRGLRAALRRCSEVECVGEVSNGREAVEMIQRLAPDLVLLDVQMPGVDGFGVLQGLQGLEDPGRRPEVIFVTAFNEYAIRAFEAAAVDYVVKPYTQERLVAAVERAVRRLREAQAATSHKRLLAALPQRDGSAGEPGSYLSRIVVSVGNKGLVVPLAAVVAFRARGAYTLIVTERERHVLRRSLHKLEAELDPRVFIRVHRSSLVSLGAVRAVEHLGADRLCLRLQGDVRVNVSRSRKEHVLRQISSVRG